MKNSIYLLLNLTIFLAACSSGPSPENVVKSFHSALLSHEWGTAKELATESSRKLIDDLSLRSEQFGFNRDEKVELTSVICNAQSETKSECKCLEKNGNEFIYKIEKVDDKWLIRYEISANDVARIFHFAIRTHEWNSAIDFASIEGKMSINAEKELTEMTKIEKRTKIAFRTIRCDSEKEGVVICSCIEDNDELFKYDLIREGDKWVVNYQSKPSLYVKAFHEFLTTQNWDYAKKLASEKGKENVDAAQKVAQEMGALEGEVPAKPNIEEVTCDDVKDNSTTCYCMEKGGKETKYRVVMENSRWVVDYSKLGYQEDAE